MTAPLPAPDDLRLRQCRFVLFSTSHPGNIGASARAIRTMGFDRLSLVAPHRFPDPQATAMAASARSVLDAAQVTADLPTALADCHWVVGASARLRGVNLPELTPREAAAHAASVVAQGGQVAVLFGNERTGLENDQLAKCHATVVIPADPSYSSLNLAQAVQLLAYELRLALCGAHEHTLNVRTEPLATALHMERFFEHLTQMLEDIDFHKGRSSQTIMRRLRRLFQRIPLEERELRILRGIFADAQRMALLAGERADARPPR